MQSGRQREFDVVLEPQDEGGYTVYVPELPGCVSEGDSREEALTAIKEAIEGYLESLEAHGDPVPRSDIGRVTVGA